MKKVLSILLVMGMICSCFVSVSAGTAAIYVSPYGDDSNAGTMAEPLASLTKACEIADDGMTIYLMGGTYTVTEAAVIDGAKDLTIRNFNGEEVTLLASNVIDGGFVKKVTDTAILDRIVTKEARNNLYSVNMTEAGITEFGSIGMRGMGYPSVPNDPQLLINGERQTLARYPDNDYLTVDEVIDPSVAPRNEADSNIMNYQGKGIKIRTNDARVSKWKEANDVHMFGYFMHDWAEATLSCTIDFSNKNTITTEYPSHYGVTENRRFYFFNLLEEISMPGEWYLDRETGMLYVYLTADMTKADLEFVTFSEPFIKVENSDHVQIQGITVQNGLDYGITVDKSENVTISDCAFREVCGTAIVMTDSYDSTVTYCEFTNLGAGGVSISGGDRQTLTPANCSVTNCTFKGLQRTLVNGYPAVKLAGAGSTVSHNEISDLKMIAIQYTGNNHVIEYNEIYDVCKDTSDTGAIYTGRSWTDRGNVIRYNYIHDMKMIDTATGMKMCAVYLDDCHSSTAVYGNVFYNIEQIALYGGGRDNTFENNLMINCSQPFRLDSRGLGWMATNDSMQTMYDRLEEVPYKEGIWAESYPELVNILDDNQEGSPNGNVIKNNVQYQSAGYNIDQVAQENGTVENNIEISNKKNFVDFANKDFTLADDSEVFTKLPDFEAIPFREIGVEEKTDVKTVEDVLYSSVVLKLNTPNTYAFGITGMIDADNSAVVPFSQDGRTLVPVRFVAEAFGGTVSWDADTRTVGITSGDTVVELQLDKPEMTVNGQSVALDVPAQISNERTVLPLRAVAEALGKNVFWDQRGLIVISNEAILNAEETDLVDGIVGLFDR